jgi:valyl-tRNA synthetase
VIGDVHSAGASYRLDLAAQALYEFAWHEFCDWYLELTKPVLTNADAPEAQLRGTRNTLSDVLGALLRLLHPLMPFITEEIWLALCKRTGRESESIMLEAAAEAEDFANDTQADGELAWLKEFVIGIRQIRGEMDLSPSRALPVKLAGATAEDRARVDGLKTYLMSLARLESIELVADADAVKGAATALLGQMRLLVPLAGLIDLQAERERLKKRREQAESDLGKCRRKLDNAQFVANAPAQIVAKERSRAHELAQRLQQLDFQLTRLRELG